MSRGGVTVDIGQLSQAVQEALKEYENVTKEALEKACEDTAKEVADDIKENASASFGGRGIYPKTWRYKKKETSDTKVRYVVYAIGEGVQLSHLLEYGHATRKGGRYNGKLHIAPARDKAEKKFIENLKKGLTAENDT